VAYFQRKKSGKVVAYYYDREHSKAVVIKALPPEVHTLSDDEINEWLVNWEISKGYDRSKARRKSLSEDSDVNKAFNHYVRDKQDAGVSKRTLVNERQMFDLLCSYFILKHECQTLQDWHSHQFGLKNWLRDQEYSDKHRAQTVQTFNRFGNWCRENGYIAIAWKVTPYKKNLKRNKETPLPKEATPDEILSAARHLKTNHPIWCFAVLLGYFANLRPEETFQLCKSDFITGDSAILASKTYKRLKQVNLGTKLAVKITKARIEGLEEGPPKNFNSNGVVTVWNADAAKMLADLLRAFGNDLVFTHTKDYLFKTYKKVCFPLLGLTLHDLRRSSALYLGRTIGVEPFLLQDMLRHADLETTQLYTRRPDEVVESSEPDFDDVV
jgi:integrase